MRANQIDLAEKFGVMNCLECGACTFACPAKRELTQSCRMGKKIINTRRRQAAARKAAEEAAAKAAEEKKEG